MADDHRERAQAWLAQDPDPDTRAELSELLRGGDEAGLAERFGGKLEFGTAGMRGELGAGPNRMNRVTVMRTTAGLARWLGGSGLVVVGYDARHKSAAFARDAAAVLAGAGLCAQLLPEALPTPVLAYAVRALGADAGVMITASHNPPQDNGYKVFTGRGDAAPGSQIVAPMDTEISARIDAIGPVDRLPLAEPAMLESGPGAIVDRYLNAVTAVAIGTARAVTTTYTPLHGVGGPTLLAAFQRAGFPPPSVVAEQAEPDPDFATVDFPNPEEPGVMDLALAAGERAGSDLILANDPDADRLAVALPGHGLLSGDEVGALLGEYVLRGTTGPDRIVATTIVSSSLLAELAAEHGVRYAQTLTGFKWLVRAGGRGLRNVFCYEEALGYCVGGGAGADGLAVADKDGIGAALAVAALAAEAKAGGRSLLDLLDDQARRYGVHLTVPYSLRVEDPERIAAIMSRLRAEPPSRIGGRVVLRAQDLALGGDGLPGTDALRYRLDGGGRVVLRPSGTEPKLKAYLEVVHPVGGGDAAGAAGDVMGDVRTVREQARTDIELLRAAVAELLDIEAPHMM